MTEFYGSKERVYDDNKFEQDFRNIIGSPKPTPCAVAERVKAENRDKFEQSTKRA